MGHCQTCGSETKPGEAVCYDCYEDGLMRNEAMERERMSWLDRFNDDDRDMWRARREDEIRMEAADVAGEMEGDDDSD